jgi:hypothetical protein
MNRHANIEVCRYQNGIGNLLLWFGFDGEVMCFDFADKTEWKFMYRVARALKRFGDCRVKHGGKDVLIVPVNGISICYDDLSNFFGENEE